MNNTILLTPYVPTQAVISNGVITGTQWTNTQNIFYVDGNVASSAQGAGQASDFIIGNFNLNLPQDAVVVGIQMELVAEYAALTSPIATITPYFVDNTSGQNVYYPGDVFTGLTPDIATYTLGGSTYQFNTSLSVNQVNNMKIALVASGGVNVDSFLVQAYYYIPSPITPAPIVPTNNCIDCNSPVQMQAMYLALPMSTTDTVFYLQPGSLQYPNGTPFQPGDVGSCGGEVVWVFDEGQAAGNGNNFEENAVAPIIEGDPTDSATFTVLSNDVIAVDIKSINNRGLQFHTPYEHDATLLSNHAANSKVIISNSGRFYLRFVRTCQVGIVFSAPITVESNSAVITDPTVIFNFKNGFTVTPNGSNPEQVDITNSGATVTPPQVVGIGSGTSGSTQVSSLTYTVPVSGVNRGAVVQISTQESVTISSVTVGGTSCTQKSVSTDTPTDIREETWVCVAPPVGTQDVVITLSAPAYVTSGSEAVVNADQSSPVGAVANATGTSFNPSISLTTTRTNSLIVDGLATRMTPILYTQGTGQSLNWEIFANSSTLQGASSDAPSGTEPDAVTMQWTLTQDTPWCYTAVEILGINPDLGGVQSVTGLNTDNTDPENPIIEISVDGSTVTGLGTPASPLVAHAGGTSGVVKVDSSDTTAGYLDPKLNIHSSDASVTVTKTITNPSGNEVLDYDLTTSGGGSGSYFVTAGQLVSGTSIVNVTITHTLGVTPKYVKVHANGYQGGSAGVSFSQSYGVYDVIGNAYYTVTGNTDDPSNVVNVSGSPAGPTITATVTSVTSSHVILSIPAGTGKSCGYVMELTA